MTVASRCYHFILPAGGEWWILTKDFKDKAKPFKFMELPFELRLMVYTWTLHHPLRSKYGWSIDRHYTLNKQDLYDRFYRQPQRLSTKGPGDWDLLTRSIDKLLALTMVNKQIATEALPVFYRTNFFYFSSPKILGRFYAGIPNRTQWMRNTILNFNPVLYGHECKRSIAQLFNTNPATCTLSSTRRSCRSRTPS
jgi:hypothetical protein